MICCSWLKFDACGQGIDFPPDFPPDFIGNKNGRRVGARANCVEFFCVARASMFTTKLPTTPMALLPRCFNISAFTSLRNLNARSSISACRTEDSVMFRNPTPVFFIRRWAHRSAIICRQFDRRHHAKRPQRVTVAGKFFSCADIIARCHTPGLFHSEVGAAAPLSACQ